MKIIDYFDSDNREALKAKIGDCHWSAAGFLVELLDKGTFYEMLGGWGHIYLLMDGENLVSFLTLTGLDAVRDARLTPWIGFVFTGPEYRGHRYAGKLLAHAEEAAAGLGYSRVYIGTDHVGLYEKYGYAYQESQVDIWGDEMRVLYKNVEEVK